jgi:hypothetical protein
MTRLRIVITILALFVLSACVKPVIYDSDEQVAKVSYSSKEPTSITLVTVINRFNGSGGHTAIVINGSQRVVFDPAGTFKSKYVAERNDFIYGMSPAVLSAYYSYHARKRWRVVTQTVEVTPEIAEMVFQSAKNYGPVADGYCAKSSTKILRAIPGFESLPNTFFPVRTMNAFAELPGVTTQTIIEDD